MILRPSPIRSVSALESAVLCSGCLSRFLQPSLRTPRRTFGTRVLREDFTVGRSAVRVLRKGFFSVNGTSANSAFRKGFFASLSQSNGSPTQAEQAPSSNTKGTISHNLSSSPGEELPHRRRQRLRQESVASAASNGAEQQLPLDASAQLSNLSSTLPVTSLRRKLAAFLALTKPRLSFLVVLTTTSAYSLYPVPSVLALDPSVTPLPALSTTTLTLLYLTVGTMLSSGCANTLNMLFEPKYDALMSRTRSRPLVRNLLSRRAAMLFAAGTAGVGLTALWYGTNPTVAALSALNIFIYAFVYTPMKRISVVNTWAGAIVGAIPPLMGWAAAAGQVATTGHDSWRDLLFTADAIGGWLTAAFLFAWQFPHFNSLSHTIREEYKAAGHKMLAWVNPAMNARVALRYSILMFPICAGFWWYGYVNSTFLVGGTLVNTWMLREAWRFYKFQGGKGSARGLFWASVWHLPLILVGALATKTGVWDGVWNRAVKLINGEEDEDEEEYEDEEETDAETNSHASPHVVAGVQTGAQPTA